MRSAGRRNTARSSRVRWSSDAMRQCSGALLSGAVLGYEISTDQARLDLDVIHRFLSEDAYWSPGEARDVVERALANSLCFGLYAPDGAQAGFARAVTDRAPFAYLADVFVLPELRASG